MTTDDLSRNAASAPLVCVTGGTGYIGRSTVRALLDAGWRVRALDVTEMDLPEGAELRTIDVLDTDGVTEALTGATALVHLAGLVAADADSDPDAARSVNEEGTASVLEACTRAGVERVVFASTFLVYTGSEDDEMTEGSEIDLDSLKPFARSKFVGEKLVRHWGAQEGRSCVSLRIGSVYGPGGGSNVIRTFIEEAIEGKELEVWGMGRRMRPLIHVHDVAETIVRSVDHLCRGGASDLFNCVGPQAYSTRDILDELQSLMPTAQVSYLTEKPEGVGDVCPSTDRIQQSLGWTPSIGLKEGMRSTYAWFRDVTAAPRVAEGTEGE